MGKWFFRWVKILRDKRGSQTIEYVAVMAGAALLAMILNLVMESNEVQSALQEKIECVIVQNCEGERVAQPSPKRDETSSDVIPESLYDPWASTDSLWDNTQSDSPSDGSASNDEPGFFESLLGDIKDGWETAKGTVNDGRDWLADKVEAGWEWTKQKASDGWEWVKDNKEYIAAGAVVAAGVGLMFVPGGQLLGGSILAGALVSGGIAAYGGADSKEIAQAAMFGGLTGAVGGGVGNVVGRGLMAGLSRAASSNFVCTRFPALASGISAGGSESLADDFLHGRKLDWKNAGIAALTAGGMLVGGSFGTHLMDATTPTGPIAGIKAANQQQPQQQRPTWQKSEKDVGKDLGEGYSSQKSFKDGEEATHSKKGSTRPDHYADGHSVEVKNYNVTTSRGRSNLVRNVTKQVEKRRSNLPEGTKQTIIIDVRGQDVSQDELIKLHNRIKEKAGDDVEIIFKRKG
ncbi:DUF4244 domain-containing protein [Desmospora profundinema]|uniref:tRNA nuclease CdiA C-terminal domain-containing protein n=1 Tax=Desmospora profundinema TaxID=1571184 RepID=A0ABU1IJ47_9BACL|nr:DUF4244 domain-containing protein [Desmospora profundinema]MDR6224184.1 hypothetical protein [Desmospora profundinema]